MGELQVSEAVVAGVAKSLRSAVVETNSGLTGVDGELGRQLGSGWTGQAGSAFGEVWTRWHEGAQNVVKGLESMASALEHAAQGYGGAENPPSHARRFDRPLLAGVDQMSAFHSKLERTLASGQSSVTALGSAWHGDAASAQQAAQQQWNEGAADLSLRLRAGHIAAIRAVGR